MPSARRTNSSPPPGFTLVELLVVIGIIVLLMGLLLPVLSRVREQAMRVKCASNLHTNGQAIRIFATAHQGRVPYAQCTPWSNGGSWWGSWMYAKDYLELIRTCGTTRLMFICPTVQARNPGEDVWFKAGSELQARQQTNQDPDYVRQWVWPDADLSDHWCQFDYSYMGVNAQATFGGPLPWEVRSLTEHTTTGNAYNDANPPLMADTAFYQPSAAGYIYNHGGVWRRDAAGNNVGEVFANVLYVDGHVEGHPAERDPYTQYGGPAYFFR